MQTKEAIEKVLDALNDDPKVVEGMETDVEGTLRTLVGNDVSEQDLANLTKGTSKIFSDKAIAALFLKLLKKKANRSGHDDDNSLLSSLLGSSVGTNLLLSLIGKKADEIPALDLLLGAANGKDDKDDKDDKTGLLGSLLGSILK